MPPINKKKKLDSTHSSSEQANPGKPAKTVVKQVMPRKILAVNECKDLNLPSEIIAELKLLVAGYRYDAVEIDITKMGSQHKRRFRQALKCYTTRGIHFNFELKIGEDKKIMVVTQGEPMFPGDKSNGVNNLTPETIAELESLLARNRTSVEINVGKQRGRVLKKTVFAAQTFAAMHRAKFNVSKIIRGTERVLIVTIGSKSKAASVPSSDKKVSEMGLHITEFKDDDPLPSEVIAALESLLAGRQSKVRVNITQLGSNQKKRFHLAVKTYAVHQKSSGSSGRLHTLVKKRGEERVLVVTQSGNSVPA